MTSGLYIFQERIYAVADNKGFIKITHYTMLGLGAREKGEGFYHLFLDFHNQNSRHINH